VHAVGSDIGVNLAVWAGVGPFLRRWTVLLPYLVSLRHPL